MKIDIFMFGLTLFFIGLFFTIITFGIGIICIWPIIFIGFILMIFGLILPSRRDKDRFDYSSDINRSRFCPSCGRNIDFDANFCSYCGREFKEY